MAATALPFFFAGHGEAVGVELGVLLFLVDVGAVLHQGASADGGAAQNEGVFLCGLRHFGEILFHAVGKTVADHQHFQLFG